MPTNATTATDPQDDDFEIVLGADIPEVDDGTYPATLVELRTFEIDDPDKPGEKRKLISWGWALEDGTIVEGVSSMATSSSSKLWKWCTALLGAEAMANGVRFTRTELIGREALVSVEHKNDWPRVADVVALPKAA